LPAIATLARLRAAGDRILGIDAQLSGTLGFVLTRTQAGHSLRSALTDAVELGIAEPDPRIDLGGEDVRRKLAILLRAAGFEVEATRIELQPLLRLAGGAWQERIDEHETFWRDQVLAAHARHERLVYCARFDGRQARVGLASVPDSHPLAAARHTENRIVIHSEAHREIPIVIAGAGAGVRITAQSVMADIDDVCRRLLTAPVEAQLRRSA
jgi:homoserine dehydrogenase